MQDALPEAMPLTVPEAMPLTVRLSCTGWLPDGFTTEEAVLAARAFAAAGCDLVVASSGQTDPAARPPAGPLSPGASGPRSAS